MTAKSAVFQFRGTQYEEMKPMMGTKMMKVVLSQLTCWCQLAQVMGVSAMCTFLVSAFAPAARRGL